MKALYQPENEVELSLIKSIFESESIQYFVRNDHFGSLKIGPQIDLFNTKMILVQEEQFEEAKEILSDIIGNIREDSSNNQTSQYSISDKIRMVLETILFFWFVPGKKKRPKK